MKYICYVHIRQQGGFFLTKILNIKKGGENY